jgi:hypothetical protein
VIDLSRPVRTRDGRPVMFFGQAREGLIAGGIPKSDGSRGHIGHLWGMESGICLDIDEPDPRHPDNLVNVPRVYDDQYIERWSTIYLKRGLHDLGILMQTFLEYPHDILRALEGDDNFEPLLPAQRTVYIERLGEEEALEAEARLLPSDARLRDGGYTAPFKHHGYKWSRERNRAKR